MDDINDTTIPTIDKRMTVAVQSMKQDNPELFDPLADKLLEFCKSPDDVNYIYKLNEKMGLPDVFCNGDLHAQNMMWIKNEDGNASDELMALFDWQVMES